MSSKSGEFSEPHPVTCAYFEDCGGGALFAVNVAITDEETEEVVACPACVAEFLDGYGNSESEVRELEPAERWEVGRDV